MSALVAINKLNHYYICRLPGYILIPEFFARISKYTLESLRETGMEIAMTAPDFEANINVDTHTGPAFSLRNRLARAIWEITALLFFRFSPRPFHEWRSFLLRCFGARVGRGVHVYPGAKIWAPWNLELADECGIASGAILYCQGKITIGRRAVVSQGVHLVTGTHDHSKLGFPLLTKPICIGDHAWIAAEAFVHPGVTIGEGCVVGARSVVMADTPDWTICAGHPCVSLKPRKFPK